jgi:hypothetical protein
MSRRLSILILSSFGLAAACGGASMKASPNNGFFPDGGAGGDGGVPLQCTSDPDCGQGKKCQGGVCVDLPPEQETNLDAVTPVASARYLWAVSSDSQVARIEVATRAIETATVPSGTTALAGLPNADAALALSAGSRAITVIENIAAPQRADLSRAYGSLSLSPDGAWAVAWSRELSGTPSGISTVAAVDVAALRAGHPSLYERAGGYRATNVFFRVENGVATKVVVVAKDAVNVLDLAGIASQSLPRHIPLPVEAGGDVTSREAVATPDGRFVFVRVFGQSWLAAVDVDSPAGTSFTVTLPGAPTDLDLAASGDLAVAVLRAEGEVLLIHLPGDLVDPSGIGVISTGALHVGQAALSPGFPAAGVNPYALLFTSAEPVEALTRLDLATLALTTYPLEKSVAAVAPAPGGAQAVVLHQAVANSTATDPYERAVDAQEGYSLLDIATGLTTLQLTGAVKAGPVAFAPAGGHAAVLLQPQTGPGGVASLELATLVARSIFLESPALFLGPLPVIPGDPGSGRGVFVSQKHPAGRISFLDLESLDVQTVTGFELNGQIGVRSDASTGGSSR